MFRKYEKEYYSKIDFLMLFSINPLFGKGENYNEIKSVFKQKEMAVSKQAIMFNTIKEIFDFLKNIPIQNLTKTEFHKIKKNLGIKKENDEIIESLLRVFENNEKNDVPTFSTKVFAFIVKNEIFNEFSVEIGLLFMNAILYHNQYIPMVLYRNNFDYFKSLIKNNITLESLVDIFAKLKDVSMRYDNQYEKSTKQNIIDILIFNQEKIQNKFQVEKIWLFGSYVRDDATPYSDVDLFIQMKDKAKKDKLKEYLCEILKRPVDIQIEGDYHQNFTLNLALAERELIINAS